MADQISVLIEHSDITITRAAYVGRLNRVLHCVLDIEIAAEIPDIEWRKVGRYGRIGEISGKSDRNISRAPDVDLAASEICGIKCGASRTGADGETFIDGALG